MGHSQVAKSVRERKEERPDFTVLTLDACGEPTSEAHLLLAPNTLQMHYLKEMPNELLPKKRGPVFRPRKAGIRNGVLTNLNQYFNIPCMAIRSDYLHTTIDISELPVTIAGVVQLIKNSGVQFDAVAFRGTSGLLVAPSVAMALNKSMILVRKYNTEDSHSFCRVEGETDAATYVIIDDFIRSGSTVRAIAQEIASAGIKSECVGIFTYRPANFVSPQDFKDKTGRDI
jgi:hypothetical protein